MLKSSCQEWIQSESDIYVVCYTSVVQTNMSQVSTQLKRNSRVESALYDVIEGVGSTFSDKVVSDLTTQLTTNKRHTCQRVYKEILKHHTGILQNLCACEWVERYLYPQPFCVRSSNQHPRDVSGRNKHTKQR